MRNIVKRLNVSIVGANCKPQLLLTSLDKIKKVHTLGRLFAKNFLKDSLLKQKI